MVEPTESEDLAEIDRFCDAMIAIRSEIDEVAAGRVADGRQPAGERAAHRGQALVGEWDAPVHRARRPSTRPASTGAAKYWPPVRRIDGAYGDRNLVCACPPPEAFAD